VPKIIEPTLIRTSATLSANAGGATTEMDFNFGNLEGARLLNVEWSGSVADDTTGLIEFGLHFQATAAAPAASLDLASNQDVFATRTIQIIDITGVGNFVVVYPNVNLEPIGIDILSNIAAQMFNSGGVARTGVAKIYYKRLLFTQRELGGQLAVRR